MDPRQYLLDWSFHYAQHKAVFAGGEEKVSIEGDEVRVKSSHKSMLYVPMLDLGDFSETKPQKDESVYVVTFNTKDNLAAMVKKWKAFSAHRNVLVIFLNPLSKLDKTWSIHPYVHAMICDEKALAPGLKSLFANVEPFKATDVARLK